MCTKINRCEPNTLSKYEFYLKQLVPYTLTVWHLIESCNSLSPSTKMMLCWSIWTYHITTTHHQELLNLQLYIIWMLNFVQESCYSPKQVMGRKNKGYMKRKGTWFKKGHTFGIRGKDLLSAKKSTESVNLVKFVRLSKEEQRMVENNPIVTASELPVPAEGRSTTKFKFLRPRPETPHGSQDQPSKADIQR